ncbi:MAG: hypothetical protein J0I06_11610 [Planctomycetes bacterium]|nr:hypothetical protein [Planctomycetota bacterium]
METAVWVALIAAAATISSAVIAKLAIGRDARNESTIASSAEPSNEIEILPQLQRKYGLSLRPTLNSVKFCQEGGRCFLCLVTRETVAGYLQNEIVKRDDLGFIADDRNPDGLYFSPTRSITENVRRLIEDLDDVSIINCTDLFTDEAAALVQEGTRAK